MTKLRLFLGAAALALLGGAWSLGGVFQLSKPTLPTCSATYEGGLVRQGGGSSEGYMRLCYCVSDGAASPAYQWCSTTFAAGAATTTCAGGSNTVCP